MTPTETTSTVLGTGGINMNESENETEYDDDYLKEQHIDRKAREGWTYCEECGDRIHLNDVREGVRCSCDDE